MVLDHDGQAFVPGIHRRALGHGPALQDAGVLQAEVVVKAAGLVLLNHESGLAAGGGP
jgi:hypothetical protein